MTETFEQEIKIERLGSNSVARQVLYDATRISELRETLFVPEQSNITHLETNITGRAQVAIHLYEGLQVVSKHYHRGGAMASLLGDKYFGVKAERSRSFREWCMLSTMKKQGLPVPAPIAASRSQHGLMYRADLVTEYIDETQTLADWCMRDPVESSEWREIGAVIRRFHNSNVYHADLNARNILIDPGGRISLIDFDKSGFRLMGESWRASNLARFKRSLDKFARQHTGFHFTEANWKSLVSSYSQ